MLVTCDAVQNYECVREAERVSGLKASVLMGPVTWFLGFSGRVMVPDMFCKMCSPDGKVTGLRTDFERLLRQVRARAPAHHHAPQPAAPAGRRGGADARRAAQEWAHLIPGHGFLALDAAKEDLLSHLRLPARLGPDFMLLEAGAEC